MVKNINCKIIHTLYKFIGRYVFFNITYKFFLSIKQYDNMRQQFLEELKMILFDFQLNVEVLKAA